MFAVKPTNLENLKMDIRASQHRRLPCRRAVNRLLSGGADLIEITNEGPNEEDTYDVDLVVTFPTGKTVTIEFSLHVCNDSFETIYEELLKSGKEINDLIQQHGKDSIDEKWVLVQNFATLLKEEQTWRKMLCRKLSQVGTKKVGRFRVHSHSCRKKFDCQKIK